MTPPRGDPLDSSAQRQRKAGILEREADSAGVVTFESEEQLRGSRWIGVTVLPRWHRSTSARSGICRGGCGRHRTVVFKLRNGTYTSCRSRLDYVRGGDQSQSRQATMRGARGGVYSNVRAWEGRHGRCLGHERGAIELTTIRSNSARSARRPSTSRWATDAQAPSMRATRHHHAVAPVNTSVVISSQCHACDPNSLSPRAMAM